MDIQCVVIFKPKRKENSPVLTSPSHDWHVYFPTNEESTTLAPLIRNLDRLARQKQWQDYMLFGGVLASQIKE